MPQEPVAAPAESRFLAITDLLNPDGTFKDPKLEDAYQRYTQKKARQKSPAKDRSEWARSQTSGDYRPLLEAILGPDFFKQGGIINIRDKPRPRSYEWQRYLADVAEVQPFIREVLAKAGIDPKTGIPGGRISVGAFNGAKGVVAEVLARPFEADILRNVRKDTPNAVIMRGLKIRLNRGGKLTAWKQFTERRHRLFRRAEPQAARALRGEERVSRRAGGNRAILRMGRGTSDDGQRGLGPGPRAGCVRPHGRAASGRYRHRGRPGQRPDIHHHTRRSGEPRHGVGDADGNRARADRAE